MSFLLTLVNLLAVFVSFITLILFAVRWYYQRYVLVQQPATSTPGTGDKLIIGFFHPYCNSGGGGERVLWKMIAALTAMSQRIHIVIYTGDTESDTEIIARAAERFNIAPETINRRLEFVRLRRRHILEASNYPRFTMFAQSAASVYLAFTSLTARKPHVYIDTTGFAFTYPLAAFIFGCDVACYTHYPTISTDMLSVVYQRRPTYNNSNAITESFMQNTIKLIYYVTFAIAYSAVGRWSECTIVNSSWTKAHIATLWRRTAVLHLVYPPCDTNTLSQLPLKRIPPLIMPSVNGSTKKTSANGATESASDQGYRDPLIISVSQFRPEKDHPLQLRAFAEFLRQQRAYHAQHGDIPLRKVKLVMIGGCRDAGDRERVEQLRQLCIQLDLTLSDSDQDGDVDFAINIPFDQLKTYFGRASVGIHTMWNEHFGIGVVEFQAAALITVAHASAGPAMDIVIPNNQGIPTGILCTNVNEYATALMRIFCSEWSGSNDMEQIRIIARQQCQRFSDNQFTNEIQNVLTQFLIKHRSNNIMSQPRRLHDNHNNLNNNNNNIVSTAVIEQSQYGLNGLLSLQTILTFFTLMIYLLLRNPMVTIIMAFIILIEMLPFTRVNNVIYKP